MVLPKIANKTVFTFILLGFVGGTILVDPARAQYTSVLEGSVIDQSGAPIPGAKIGVINEATNVRYGGVSTETGAFRVAALPAGTYRLEVQAGGFRTRIQSGVLLEPNQVRTVNPALELGTLTTAVEVVAAANAIETAKSQAAATIETREVTEAPLFGRNVYTGLVALAPLITGNGEHTGGTATFSVDNYGTEISPNINAAGQRLETNEYHLDGSLITLVSMGGVVVIDPAPDTVEELKVTASDFSADRARFSGALIQVFSRSGTNRIHGTLSEFHTNNDLTSRRVFESSIPVFRRNEFGGTIGGPIRKDRTFFFGSISVLRGSRSDTLVSTVESQQFLQFLQNNFPNKIATTVLAQAPPQVYPTADILTVGQLKANPNIPSFFPAPNIPDDLPIQGTAVVERVPPRNGLQWHFRVDHNFGGGRDRVFYSMWRNTANDEFPDPRPIQRIFTKEHGIQGKVNWVHSFSPTLMNEASMSALKTYGLFGIRKPELPQAYVGGISGPGTWGPGAWGNPDFSWHEVLSWMHRSHNLRVGMDVDRQKDFDDFTELHNRATWVFGNLLDFAQDLPYFQSGPTIDTSTGQAATDVVMRQRIFYMAPFIQDDWKITPRLTLNLGLRFDYFGHLASILNDRIPIGKFTPGQGNTFSERVANGFMALRGGDKGYQTVGSVAGFAPRIGFGWDIFGNGTTALRGGYGIYYNRLPNEAYRADEAPPRWVDPAISIFDLTPPVFSYALGPIFQAPPSFHPVINPRGGIVGLRVSAQGLEPFLDPPLTDSWMVSLQRTLGHDFLIEADYAGTHSSHLYTFYSDVNRFAGDLVKNKGTLTRLNPFFGGISFGRANGTADSHYGSIMINKRYSRSFSLRGIFTFGKATDDNSSFCTNAFSGCGTVLDVENLTRQHGRSDFSIGKRLSLDSVAELPVPWKTGLASKLLGGWRMSTIVLLQSGLPFNVICSASFSPVYQVPNDPSTPLVGNSGCDYNADGYNWDFPNQPAFGNSISASRSKFLSGLFKVSDFSVPALGQEGNLGRNTFAGPGLANVNVNFAKATKVPWFTREGATLEIRAEVFNLFNRVNLGLPVSDLSSGLFGHSTSQDLPRATQFGIHLSF